MDNTTAIAYLNQFGGGGWEISPETKQHCMDRNINLLANHLAGDLNVTADEESRVMKDRTDWILCPGAFQDIIRQVGPLQVDLFAYRLTNHLHCQVFFSPA